MGNQEDPQSFLNLQLQNLNDLTNILDAADKLFRKYGIRSVTMTEIARELGISKKTLYVHIENKQDLVAKIVNNYISEEKQMCNDVVIDADNALDELLRISVYVQNQIKAMNPSIIYDLQKYYRSVWKLMDGFHRTYILNMAERNLQRGVEEGIYRADLDIKIIAKIYVGLFPILSDGETFSLEEYTTSKIYGEFMKYHIHGIVSAKGRAVLEEFMKENTLNSIIF